MNQLDLKMNNMPFEGLPHRGTIILLPYRCDTWRCDALYALDVFYNLVSIISKYEMVYLVCDPSIDDKKIERFKMKNVLILRLEYNDAWARDNTLIYVKNNNKNVAIDFRFNAWGGSVDGLYSDYRADDALGKKLAKALNDECVSLDNFILEGGSIHTDGEGTFLTTEACLLSKGRNNLSKEEIEAVLSKYLGAKKVLWLKHGIHNDETNEHVDNMACFLKPGVVLVADCDDESDIQYKYSKDAIRYLENECDAKGRKLKVIKIPTPINLKMTRDEAEGLDKTDAIERCEGDRLAGSYVNFYQSDRFVIVPKYGNLLDDIAFNILKEFYQNKDVYQLESREILLAGGNIHCVTMQIPKED